MAANQNAVSALDSGNAALELLRDNPFIDTPDFDFFDYRFVINFL